MYLLAIHGINIKLHMAIFRQAEFNGSGRIKRIGKVTVEFHLFQNRNGSRWRLL